MKSIVSILACAALSSLVAAGNGEFSVSVSLVGRTTIQFDVGCTCDADCNGRYSYEAVCQKNICVKKDAVPASTPCPTSTSPSSVIVAPTSQTTQQQNVGCTCDADCKGRYPYDTVCEHNICVKKDAQPTSQPTSSPITKTTTVSMPCSTSSKVEPESRTTAPSSPASSMIVAPTSRTTQQQNVGCTCDADCKGRYSYEAVCFHNICVKKDAESTTMSSPASTPLSSIVQPTSRTTQDHHAGCTCDEDCGEGSYCDHGACKQKATVQPSKPASTPCKTTPTMSPSVTIAPTSRTTQDHHVGCTCDEDCGEGYYCDKGTCKKKATVEPTSPTTSPCTTTPTSPSVTIQPISRTTQDHHVGCSCDEDCGAGYYCDKGMCKKKATVEPTSPTTSPCTTTPSVTIQPTSRTTQDHHAGGCTCDEDCGAGYYCDKGTCKKKATVEPTSPTTSPCTTSPSVTVLPTSRTTQDHHVGCTCDEDCGEGYYCDNGMCKHKATVNPTQPIIPCTKCATSPSVTVLPTRRTTQDHHVGCTCDEDCGDGYYCDNGTCKHKATVIPTQRDTTSCTTTPSVTLLPTQRTTMTTVVTPTTSVPVTTLPVFESSAWKNGVSWTVGIVGALVVLLA